MKKLHLIEINTDSSQCILSCDESEEHAVHHQYYQIIRNVLLFFVGFGAPLNSWLKPNDPYAHIFEAYPRSWFCYKLYCWLLVHLGLVLNVSSIVYLLIWMNKDFSEMCQLIAQFIWNLSSAVALDLAYFYRNATLLKASSKKRNHPLTLTDDYPRPDIEYPWHMKFLKYFHKFHSTHRWQSLKVFLFAIVFNVYLYYELIFNFRHLNIEKLLNIFMFVNIFIVSISILSYMAFCLVFRNKFRLLNVYIRALTKQQNTNMDQLFIISKWYQHNYSKVLKFDNTFNLFIVTFYISIIFNLVISLYGIVLHSHVKTDGHFAHIIFYNILYYSFIAFNTILGILYAYIAFKSASDVNVVSDKTKKLIEKYVICTDYGKRSLEFNVEYQHFNTTVFSKPVHLTLFGLGSITKMSLGVALISILPYVPKIIEFTIKNPMPINDLNQYFEDFVNDTIEELTIDSR